MMDDCEIFGDEAQQKLQRRYFRFWPYLKAHPRLSFVGRAIGIDDPALDEVENLAGLTRELGFLATAPSERRRGFAHLLLARVILASYEEYATGFVHTGVRADNAASQQVCRGCALVVSYKRCCGKLHC